MRHVLSYSLIGGYISPILRRLSSCPLLSALSPSLRCLFFCSPCIPHSTPLPFAPCHHFLPSPFSSTLCPFPLLLCIFFRALTFQRVSSWRVDQDVVARVSSDSMFVRDVCVAQSPLRLGDLSGNFFAITLRKEEGSNTQNSLTITGQPSASSLLSSFAAVASYPFMNIFGVQRFGSPLPSNPEVGMRLLASDYRGTCVYVHTFRSYLNFLTNFLRTYPILKLNYIV
jgi:tRNA pseudouridine synthase D (TruD)